VSLIYAHCLSFGLVGVDTGSEVFALLVCRFCTVLSELDEGASGALSDLTLDLGRDEATGDSEGSAVYAM
jgi:hypothetical protein